MVLTPDNMISRPQETEKVLTTRKLADALGISESSIKRWADGGKIRAIRTPGGHRRIPLTEAVRFTRETDLEFVNPELIGLAPRLSSPQRADAEELFYAALVEGAEQDANALLISLFLEGRSVAELIDGPVSGTLARIGELWKHKGEGIYIEHRATEILLRILRRIYDLLPVPAADAPKAFGCAPAGDVYQVPTFAVAMVFREMRWQDTNFGPDVPWKVLALAVEQFKPGAVWLAISGRAEENLELGDPVREMTDLADRLAGWNGALYCGGRGLPAGLDSTSHSNIYRLHSMTRLAQTAGDQFSKLTKGGADDEA
ncbi:helix-turn-helix domain-containing protein [bacterium]|nr:helix-turn-helix domain-containing protein [bacterium]